MSKNPDVKELNLELLSTGVGRECKQLQDPAESSFMNTVCNSEIEQGGLARAGLQGVGHNNGRYVS